MKKEKVKLPSKPSSDTSSPVVHLWVKQGKTDHMAVLVDPEILSLLKKKREGKDNGNGKGNGNGNRKRASTSNATANANTDNGSSRLVLSDLVDVHPDESVNIRWSSNNQRDSIEASVIRIRDLESEGRGSGRGGRPTRGRRSKAPEPSSPSTSSSLAHSTGRNKRLRERSRDKKAGTVKVKREFSPNREQTGDLQQQKQQQQQQLLQEQLRMHEEGQLQEKKQRQEAKKKREEDQQQQEKKATFNGDDRKTTTLIRNSSSSSSSSGCNVKDTTNQPKIIKQSKQQHFIDLLDEEFDSSDDEAIIYRMELQRKRDSFVKSETEQEKMPQQKQSIHIETIRNSKPNEHDKSTRNAEEDSWKQKGTPNSNTDDDRNSKQKQQQQQEKQHNTIDRSGESGKPPPAMKNKRYSEPVDPQERPEKRRRPNPQSVDKESSISTATATTATATLATPREEQEQIQTTIIRSKHDSLSQPSIPNKSAEPLPDPKIASPSKTMQTHASPQAHGSPQAHAQPPQVREERPPMRKAGGTNTTNWARMKRMFSVSR